MEATSRKVVIGVGVGVTTMVVFTGLMFILLIFRRRYLQRDDKYLKRVALAHGVHQSGGIDMTRTVAWSYRNGFRPEGGGPALADSRHDPTLRPLHGLNDPFFHRERQAQNGYSHSGSPRDSYSDRSGRIAIVPFRESNLPAADTSYDLDGRIRVPNGHVRGPPIPGGHRGEDFPGTRPYRARRNPVESSLGFDDELFDIAAGRRPPVNGRPLNRDVPHWRRDVDNPWMENTRHSSSPDTSRGSPPGHNVNFSRDHRNPERRLPRIQEPWMGHHWDSSHLQEVYY